MTKYQKFKEGFEKSGMSQRAYAEKMGCSASLVSQYLSKARSEKQPENDFIPISIIPSVGKVIRITTSQGLVIEVPV